MEIRCLNTLDQLALSDLFHEGSLWQRRELIPGLLNFRLYVALRVGKFDLGLRWKRNVVRLYKGKFTSVFGLHWLLETVGLCPLYI